MSEFVGGSPMHCMLVGNAMRMTSRRAFLAGAAAATAGYRMSGTEADRYSAAKALSGVKPTVAVAEIPFSTKPI